MTVTGIQFGANVAAERGEPGVARIYACLGSLALAVRHDLKQKESSNG